MKNKMNRMIVYGLSLVPLILWAVVYKKLPDLVPINWGFDGQISYGPKATVWIMALTGPLLAVMGDFLPRIDPKKKNYKRFGKYYDSFWIVIILFMLGMNLVTWSETLYPGRLSVGMIVCIGLGGLFLFMGNMMPKIKSNFFMGVKTPWTLTNEDVWNRTHRLFGKLMCISGLLFIAGAFFTDNRLMIYFVLAVALILALVPSVMSYIWYQKLTDENGEKNS